MDFLQCQPDAVSAARLERVVLPGTNMNTSWLFAMERIKANYGTECSLQVSYRRYRWLQLLNFYDHFHPNNLLATVEVRRAPMHLKWWERLFVGGSVAMSRLCGKSCTRHALRPIRKWLAQYPHCQTQLHPERFSDILEVCERIGAEAAAA